ncbi:MAG: DUF4476 domain-containing protein [Flavisolibacter sp.]
MKKILCFLIAGVLAVSAFAGTVKVTLNGNKNFVVSIDGRTYTANSMTNGKKEILITNLANGQHSIEIYRPNNRGVNKSIYSSSFNLDQNEMMNIIVNNNGGVRIEESTNNEAYGNDTYGNTYRSPMSDASYNQLFRTISNKRGQAARLTAARDVFNSSSNYLTSYQAADIIALVNTEANRLLLAKLAYDNLTDPSSYTQFYGLFNRQASIDELDTYVRNNSTYVDPYNNNNNPYNNNNYRVAMSDANFNSIYESIRKQWFPGSKMSSASDAFNVSTNYFTTAQAKKIIGLVSNESNRLELAKLSLDNLTDLSNYRQLYDLFTSQASRDELDNYYRSMNNY